VHPTCLEVYLRAHRSLYPDKPLDIDGIFEIRNSYVTQHLPFPISRCKDVQEGIMSPNWVHHQDATYLAANPIFIPGLASFIVSCTETDPSFSPYSSPFPASHAHGRANATDPWLRMNADVILNILLHLGSDDALNLRLVSRTFAHIPVVHWRRLLAEEAPWLYEAFSPDAKLLNRWAGFVATEVHEQRRQLLRHRAELAAKVNVLQQEEHNIALEYENDHEIESRDLPRMTPERTRLLELVPQPFQSSERMNWFKLYTGIVLNTDRFNGLKNRKRIWEDAVNILQRVELLRAARDRDEQGEDEMSY